MSRVGAEPVVVPGGVTVGVDDDGVHAKGPLGESSVRIVDRVSVRVDGNRIVVERQDDDRISRSMHGLMRSLIANMVEGVCKGYVKHLEIHGVGFRAAVQGQILSMTVGFSTPVEYEIPDGITVVVEGGTNLVISGVDKQLVGSVAARIRAFAPAEPYKGKGIRYKDEHVRRKVGKTVA